MTQDDYAAYRRRAAVETRKGAHFNFVLGIERERAQLLKEIIGDILKTNKLSLKMWFLERRYPEYFSRRVVFNDILEDETINKFSFTVTAARAEGADVPKPANVEEGR